MTSLLVIVMKSHVHFMVIFRNIQYNECMNDRRTKLLPKIFLGQLSVALLITAMAMSILFYAEGYRFNIKNFKVYRTGILNVVSYPKSSTVRLNGKAKSENTPYSINLTPGYYSVDINKDGYLPWTMTAKVEEGLVNNYKNVVLIKEKIETSELNDQKKIDLVNLPDDIMAQKKSSLAYNGYELWYEDKLITRFSELINKAIMYPDEEHIIFQQGDEIRLIEITGTNDTLLVKLENDNTTNFVTNSKGTELYYNDNGTYKIAVIRDDNSW